MLGDKRIRHNGEFHDRFVRTFKMYPGPAAIGR
jgi:hypothetical protein